MESRFISEYKDYISNVFVQYIYRLFIRPGPLPCVYIQLRDIPSKKLCACFSVVIRYEVFLMKGSSTLHVDTKKEVCADDSSQSNYVLLMS